MSDAKVTVGPTQPRAPQRRAGRPPKYPWDHWFNGQRKQLRPSIDFASDKNLESMRSQILLKAKQRGLHVTTEITGGYIVLDFFGDRLDVDWDSIFDGEVHQLRRGEDFDITIELCDLVAEGFKQAHARGLQIRAGADVGVVAFRAILPESTREASQPEETS